MAVFVGVLGLAGCGGPEVSRQIGARCDTSRECDDRCLPPAADYPGGFCTLVCNTTNDCPGDASCVNREGGVCLFDCAVDADCRFLGTGWTCRDTELRSPQGTQVKVCRGD